VTAGLRLTGPAVIRLLLSAVLLTLAAFKVAHFVVKGHGAFDEPVHRWLPLILAAVVESTLGGLALVRRWMIAATFTTAAVFTSIAIATTIRWLVTGGNVPCGCAGALRLATSQSVVLAGGVVLLAGIVLATSRGACGRDARPGQRTAA
jgi:hypothetical protein